MEFKIFCGFITMVVIGGLIEASPATATFIAMFLGISLGVIWRR